jgi:ESS family glutamate:Na+ symporter
MDTILQSFFMTMFFTSIGFTASLKVLKQGGVEVIKMLFLCAILIFLQNGAGVALAKAFNLNALIGLCGGSIPLVGGHGTSGAFGPMLEGYRG